MEYGWTDKNIFDDIDKLKELARNEKDFKKKMLYSKSFDALNYWAYTTYCDVEVNMSRARYEASKLHSLCLNVTGYGRYYTCVEKFYSTLSFLKKEADDIFSYMDDNDIKFTGTYLTHDDTLSLVKEFYMTIEDDEMRKIFNKIYKNRYTTYRFDNPDTKSPEYIDTMEGFTIFIGGLDKNYISVLDEAGCRKFINTVHETGHAITNIMNPGNSLRTDNDFFLEVQSLFFELIAYNIFRHEKLNESELIYSLFTTMTYYYSLANDLILQECIYQTAADNNYVADKDFFRKLRTDYNITKAYYNDLLDINFDRDATYPLSFSVAMSLVNIYLDNPKEGLELFKKVVMNPYQQEDLEFIFGLVDPFDGLAESAAAIVDSYKLVLKKQEDKNVE